MYHKIYLAIISILVVTLSLSLYISFNLSNENQKKESILRESDAVLLNNFGIEKPISLADGRDWKACKIVIYDKDLTLKRPAITSNYTISKDNICPQSPKQIFITKQEYIDYLQNNAGWGVFDSQNIYPDMIPPDIKPTNQSSSNSSK